MGTPLRNGNRATTRSGVLRAAMLLLASVATIGALLTTPFSAEEGEFFHALRSGEVGSVAVGHSADFNPDFGVSTISANANDDIAVSWVSRYGVRRVAVLADLGFLSNLAVTDDQTGTDEPGPSLDPAASITETARSLGVAAPEVRHPGGLRFDPFGWVSLLVTVLMIGFLVYGPQPRRMTKWGAFWSYLIPFNLGIFHALLRDAPWDSRMSLRPEPSPKVRGDLVDPVTNETIQRRGGGVMFLWSALVFGLAISLVLAGVSWTFPTYLDPVAWTAVDLAGNPLTR